MKNTNLFFILVLLACVSSSYANPACNSYCIGKGYAGGYCFDYNNGNGIQDDLTDAVFLGGRDSACSKDLKTCYYGFGGGLCLYLDEGSKNVCGTCEGMSVRIYCNCYNKTECATNCRSECDAKGCMNSQVIPSDATCETFCKARDCKGEKCTGGSCTAAPGLGEAWSGGVCYFGITYEKNANCPGQTDAAGYCSCWREHPCPDTSAEGLEGMAENQCDANLGCRTPGYVTPTPSPTPSPSPSPTEGTGSSGDIINRIKTAVYKIVITLYCLVLYLATAVAALFAVMTGIKYMSSDDGSSRAESRNRMIYALLGLMIIALACPLVNILFAGTNIGIPENGKLVPCKGCPYINEISTAGGDLGGWEGGYSGGGDTGGSWYTDERIKEANSFQTCSASEPCPDGRVCAATTGEYRCYPKIADGYSISASDLTPLSGINGDLCSSGYANGDKCIKNPKCSKASGCASGQYCGADSYCKTKLAEEDDCAASMMLGDTNPDVMCKSKWCVDGRCVSAGNCIGPDDCSRHYSGKYCDGNGVCKTRLSEDSVCKTGQIIGGTADEMCKDGLKCTNGLCKKP
ncbi:MAG: pilin [Candidatus Altiarchaeia archaeon]